MATLFASIDSEVSYSSSPFQVDQEFGAQLHIDLPGAALVLAIQSEAEIDRMLGALVGAQTKLRDMRAAMESRRATRVWVVQR